MKKINLDKLNGLIAETGQLIQDDAIMSNGEEIAEVAEAFDSIKDEIGGNKSNGFMNTIRSWMQKDTEFKFKSFEGKIDTIFERFDLVSNSVLSSINIFTTYEKSLATELKKIDDYIASIDETTLEQEDVLEYNTIKVIRDNLKLSQGRILMRLDSGKRLHRQMVLSRPAFQTLLSSVLIETAGQRAITASVGIMKTLGGSIDGMSARLTDSTVSNSRIALEAEVRPLLGAGEVRGHIEKLQSAMVEIEASRQQYILEAKNS